MEDLSLFFKTYQAYSTVFIVMFSLSLAWALVVRFKPKWLGFDGKADRRAYLVCLIPVIVALISTNEDLGTSMDNPRAFDMYENLLFVSGIHQSQHEDSETGTKTRVNHDLMIVVNKQGKELARFNTGSAKVHNNKIFMDGIENYIIADLTTGKVIDVLTVENIKERASALTSEKIFEFTYSSGSTFNVRTVRDKTFTYDALLNATDSNEGYTLFQRKNSTPPAYSGKTSLFQPLVIEETKSSTILLSYDDLEKKSFIVSAVEGNGNVLWSKHDNEISSSLAGANFSHPKCKANTLVDEQNVYFVTHRYLVCLSLSSGELKWMVEL